MSNKEKKIEKIIVGLQENYPNIFKVNNNNKISSILLFKDYISRLRLWKEALNKEYFPFGRSLDFDNNNLIFDINPNLSESIMSNVEFYDYLQSKLNICLEKGRVLNRMFIYFFTIWKIFEDEDIFKNYILPSPYEGIIKLFRNDSIYVGEGVNVSGVTMRNTSMNIVLPSIEDNFLEYIDSKCKLVGSDGIPNQERVSELWEEFQSLNK